VGGPSLVRDPKRRRRLGASSTSFLFGGEGGREGGLRVHLLLPLGKEVNGIVMMHHSTYHHQHKRLWLHKKGNLRNYNKKSLCFAFCFITLANIIPNLQMKITPNFLKSRLWRM